MELGLTFPLQRFLKRPPPPYGAEPDRRFCWDLHVITLRGNPCLLAVHCHSRYAFVRYDVRPLQWADLPELFRAGLLDSLAAAGFSGEQREHYLRRAGEIALTRTHGRREVAFLNRAWEDVLASDLCLDTDHQAQPLLDHAVNTRPGRCAGADGLGTALDRMTALLGNRKIIRLIENLIAGKDCSIENAQRIEVLLDDYYENDKVIQDFISDLALYRPGGGEYLYSHAEILPKAKSILAYMQKKYGRDG